MQLQQFVTETVENLGGMVMPVEYALCDVLIPETYAPYFQSKTELKLAFDFEVAQENPDAEFVTFGSYILEQLLTLVNEEAKTAMRYAVLDRLELGNPEKKIAAFLENEQGRLTIETERTVFGVWAVFQYVIAFVADEKTEKANQVWMNLLTNEVDDVMKQEQNRIMYEKKETHTYPIPGMLDINRALQKATTHVKEVSEQHQRDQTDEREIAKDIERINNYYDALLGENAKRANRKGLSEDKQKEIYAKAKTIKLERDKQLKEIYNKANGELEINLHHAILYFVPLLEYTVNSEFKGNKKQWTIFYNPITKGFFSGELIEKNK
ncbi:hypothetical protein ACLIBG_07310 [Virgibacillus sp. W0181]|uniref:hypothetical protein n=1 Tax=Virgibacillus sp. W0181 TaxID=3391581 RepID=UPI003F46D6BA